MYLKQAQHIADVVVSKLSPHCEEIKICGSVRREMEHCSDVDIVLIPKRKPIKDLFGEIMEEVPIEAFRDQIDSWDKIKGEATGKYTQRIVEDAKVEISIATSESYPIICLIRTGNADFTHMLMKRVLRCGLEQRDGLLWRDERQIPIRSEEEYFSILDLPFVPPQLRDKDAFKKVKV
jgi:DNA polymerase (family 10)